MPPRLELYHRDRASASATEPTSQVVRLLVGATLIERPVLAQTRLPQTRLPQTMVG
jgi:hypothetical protein